MDVYEHYKSQIIIVPGRQICKNCLYTHLPKWFEENPPPVLTPITPSSSSASYSSPGFVSSQYEIHTARGVLNTIAETLQLKLIDEKEWSDKKYLQHKYEQNIEGIQKAFEMGGALQMTKESTSNETQYFNEMIDQLKERMHTATKNDKHLILSVLPTSWTAHKIQKEFDVSYHFADSVKKIVAERGILAPRQPRCGKGLNVTSIELIEQFYISDEVSRIQPGIKDCITIRKNGEKIKVQKRLMLYSVGEADEFFLETHPEHPVGRSKFAELRPRQCILPGASGSHTICVCIIHHNMELLLDALNLETLDDAGTRWSYKDILERMVCDSPTELCFLGKCSNCPRTEFILKSIETLLTSNSETTVTYKQWLHTDRSNLETIVKSVEELMSELAVMLPKLLEHDFITKKQSEYSRQRREQIEPGCVIVKWDFSQNYSITIQDAVQGQYWSTDQVTVHPWVCYYRSGRQAKLEHFSVVMISEYLKHDVATVATVQKELLDLLKTKIANLERVIYFTDGTSSQYKNKGNFLNTCLHEHDHGVKAEWHFYASYHGKGPCDGVGGSFKRAAYNASLKRPKTNQIRNVTELHDWVKTDLPNIITIYVPGDQIPEMYAKLQSRFASMKGIPGTRALHCFIPCSTGSMLVKSFSSSNECETFKMADDLLSLQLVQANVIIIDQGKWWIGFILQKDFDSNEITASLI